MSPEEFFGSLKDIIGHHSNYLNNPDSAEDENVEWMIDDLNELIDEYNDEL